jgi:hypothetical protein
MKKLKENELLLTDKMKKLGCTFIVIFLFSCTSNTIFEKPKDLIPKDTMSLLIQEMMIASSAKFMKNKKLQKNINYVPFVYNKFKIDSVRFQESNFYYISKIDLYKEIITNAKTNLEKRKEVLVKLSATIDSTRKDSIEKTRIRLIKLDSLKQDSIKKIEKIKIDTTTSY